MPGLIDKIFPPKEPDQKGEAREVPQPEGTPAAKPSLLDRLFPRKEEAAPVAPPPAAAPPEPPPVEPPPAEEPAPAEEPPAEPEPVPEPAPAEAEAELVPAEAAPPEAPPERARPRWRRPLVVAGAALAAAGAALAIAYDRANEESEETAARPSPTATQALPPTATTPTTATAPTTPTTPATPLTPATPAGKLPPATEGPGVAGKPKAPKATPPAPATGGLDSWGASESGWTVVLASSPSRPAARATARRAADRGLQAGVLRSNRYSSLRSGFWVAFSGHYDSSTAARKAAGQAAAKGFPQAYARRVAP